MNREMKWIGVLCGVLLMSSLAWGYDVKLSALFNGTANLDVGSPATGTLQGLATVSGNRLVNAASSADNGAVTYGDATNYYNYTLNSTWGQNTIAAIVNLNSGNYYRKALVGDFNNNPSNWDAKNGVLFWADGTDGAYAGPAIQLLSNGNAVTFTSNAPNYSSFTQGVDWFIAVSWKDNGDNLDFRTYMARVDGTGSVYYTSGNQLFAFEPMFSDGPENLVVGARSLGTYDDQVPGSIDGIQILGNFVDSQTDFAALQASFPVPEPMSLALLALGVLGIIRRK